MVATLLAVFATILILAVVAHYVLIARHTQEAQRVALGQYRLSKDMRRAMNTRGRALKGRRALR